MFHTALFIYLSCFRIALGGSITLLNSEGSTKIPKDLDLDTSWTGLALLSEEKTGVACTAIHVDLETVTVHKDCIPKTPKASLRIHYWNRAGVQTSLDVPIGSFGGDSPAPLRSVKIAKTLGQDWNTSGDAPRQNDLWFGGFHPEWELVRLYSIEEGSKEKTFQFQVNTCKASSRSPILKRVKLATEAEDEEVLSESRLIPKTSPYAPYLIIEKCLRPMSKSSKGALITLAKDFGQKIGFLVNDTFEGIPQRELTSLQSPPKFQDGTLLRYIGADGLETGLPRDPANIEIIFSYAFEKLFPRKDISGL